MGRHRTYEILSTLVLAGLVGWAFVGSTSCVPKQQSGAAPVAAAAPGTAPGSGGSVVLAPPKPDPPPANPVPPTKDTGNIYTDRFLEMWTDIHKLSNGYFSQEGVPYHSVETLLVEAPDYGHETTSEAYSYWVWLEAMYAKVTGDFGPLKRAWASLEYYTIPSTLDQPTNQYLQPTRPATYMGEGAVPQEFPMRLDGSVQVGKDPLYKELKDTYQSPDLYGMHWLFDVDNWYGFGNRGDGTSRVSYINTFQRGAQESVWEAVTQPCWEEFKWGTPRSGFLEIFQAAPTYAKQWKYSNAPDADARVVQAMYWAKVWADEKQKGAELAEVLGKTRKLGDYLRYAFFDKYFKTQGCRSIGCPPAKEKESAAYLINWYYAWGGSIPVGNSPGWAWRIGSSFNHQGYQNPMAAYALSSVDGLKPQSPTAPQDWAISLQRQLEFYRWLQTADGPIAGGATNSWQGKYGDPGADVPTFYGMGYDWSPVFLDPPSNDWFGFQVWSVQRVAEFYYVTGDPKAKTIMDRWVTWVMANVTLKNDGSYLVPATIRWSGQPSQTWDSSHQNWDAKDKGFNAGLRAAVGERTFDVGVTAGLVHTILFYAARSRNEAARILCKELLDRMWKKYREDGKGVVTPEERKDYKRFGDPVYVPAAYAGKMPNGDPIDKNSTFVSLRSKYKQDPAWPKVDAYLKGGPAPKFTYHRFWAQTHIALAYAAYGWLFPEDKE